jgi:hypothetical protein
MIICATDSRFAQNAIGPIVFDTNQVVAPKSSQISLFAVLNVSFVVRNSWFNELKSFPLVTQNEGTIFMTYKVLTKSNWFLHMLPEIFF